MHPILGDRLRLRLYLVAWGLAGVMLAMLIRVLIGVPWTEALVFGVPMGLLAAPVSLSAWYLVRAMPLSRTSALRVGATAAGAAVITASLWAGVGRFWWQLLGRSGFDLPEERLAGPFALLAGLGALGYLLAVTVHYALQASEESAAAGRRALELQVAQRDAELRALRAQVDPHFLFNSLNAIAGLTGADPALARTMSQRLADFLRDSLALGGERWIPVEREVALAEQYLAVEQVRFGERLRVTVSVAEEAAAVEVPPLILQPLVENAVRHGVGTLLEGGEVRISAMQAGGRLLVIVANAYDSAGRRTGTGFGQGIVRRRLAAAFGDEAALGVEAGAGLYRASVTMPIVERAHES